MSDYKTLIKTRFINRRTSQTIEGVHFQNSINVNMDMRTLSSTFDFSISFRLSENVDIRSHDFVEFYYKLPNGEEYQFMVGYVEDFVRSTSPNTLTFQANGRDFLGQLFTVPFLVAKTVDQTTITSFLQSVTTSHYQPEYLKFKGISRRVIPDGAYGGIIKIQELGGSRIAPILQSTTDEIFNLVYQNRFGQYVIWGRNTENKRRTGKTLSDVKDANVSSFSARQNYSKVISEVKILYSGGEQNLNYNLQPSRPFFNSDSRARQIFQPEVRNFETATLITYLGATSVDNAKDMQAKSMMRKSNQNLNQVVIKSSLPFYIGADGQAIPYEVNQVWNIYSEVHGVNEPMKLVGLGISQSSDRLECQMAFIPEDTII